jgi:hypothetical protein
MEYIVALEIINNKPTQYIATWKGDPGRTALKENAKRYKSVSAATFGLAHARKYRDFESATIIEVMI